MTPVRPVAALLALALPLAACAGGFPSLLPDAASPETTGSAAGVARAGPARMTRIEGWGPVLATPRALEGFPADLEPRPGRNRTVDPCWEAIAGATARVGHAHVEVSSLGPDRRVGPDRYEGIVEVRIVWARDGHHEVRRTTMRCVATGDGRLVDARTLPREDGEEGLGAEPPA